MKAEFTLSIVIAGLGPAIHRAAASSGAVQTDFVSNAKAEPGRAVDCRDKPGNDE